MSPGSRCRERLLLARDPAELSGSRQYLVTWSHGMTQYKKACFHEGPCIESQRQDGGLKKNEPTITETGSGSGQVSEGCLETSSQLFGKF